MLDLVLAAVGWIGSTFISFAFGVYCLLRTLHREAPDLYCEWMDRREARKEARR